MKNFISVEYFKELKILFILEFLIILFGSILLRTPGMVEFFEINDVSLFNPYALLISLLIWGLSSLLDKKLYFNLATLLGTGFITYGSFWFMFEIMSI